MQYVKKAERLHGLGDEGIYNCTNPHLSLYTVVLCYVVLHSTIHFH